MIQTTTEDFDWTLPSKDYRDPALFERERREIFAKNWMLFSWSGRLREPGDYVTGARRGLSRLRHARRRRASSRLS